METLFDPAVYGEVLRRVESIQPGSQRQWGKMTVAQMLEHTARALEMAAGKKKSKQAFLGKMIGWNIPEGLCGPETLPEKCTDRTRLCDSGRTRLRPHEGTGEDASG